MYLSEYFPRVALKGNLSSKVEAQTLRKPCSKSRNDADFKAKLNQKQQQKHTAREGTYCCMAKQRLK